MLAYGWRWLFAVVVGVCFMKKQKKYDEAHAGIDCFSRGVKVCRAGAGGHEGDAKRCPGQCVVRALDPVPAVACN